MSRRQVEMALGRLEESVLAEVSRAERERYRHLAALGDEGARAERTRHRVRGGRQVSLRDLADRLDGKQYGGFKLWAAGAMRDDLIKVELYPQAGTFYVSHKPGSDSVKVELKWWSTQLYPTQIQKVATAARAAGWNGRNVLFVADSVSSTTGAVNYALKRIDAFLTGHPGRLLAKYLAPGGVDLT